MVIPWQQCFHHIYYSTNVFLNALMWCLHAMQDGTSWNVYKEHRIGLWYLHLEESDTQILKRSKNSLARAVFPLSLIFSFSEMVYEKPVSCSRWGSNSQPRHASMQVLLYKYRALTDCATEAHCSHTSPVEPSRADQVDTGTAPLFTVQDRFTC